MNTNEIEQVLLVHGQDWMNRVERKMVHECAQAGVVVREVVLGAYVYMIENVKDNKISGVNPKTDEDLYHLLQSKAKWLMRQAIRASQLDHGRKSVRTNNSLDQTITDDQGSEYCPSDIEASLVRWSEIQHREELAYRYAIAKMVLNQLCEQRKISRTNQCIYWCVELLEMPCAEVAEKYGVTTNNIYQVVSRIKKGLKSDGKRIYEDLYRQAA